MPTKKRTYPTLPLLLCCTLPGFIADQLTKWWTVSNLLPHQDQRVIIPDFFWWWHVKNTGVAFGFANGGAHSNLIFGAIALLACGFVFWMWRSGQFPTAIGRLAAALIISGALGNLTDRFIHGYVVDWIAIRLGALPFIADDYMWPTFNLADSYICIAASLLFYSAFQKIETDEDSPQDETTSSKNKEASDSP